MPLLEDARPAARRLLDAGANGTLQLAARADADGVLSVAILARTLARLGHSFHARFLSPVALAEPEEEAYAGRVLFGLPAPAAAALGPLVLVDPEGAAGRTAPDRIVLRPGPADGAAGAPAAFALALALDETAWDSAPYAVAATYAMGTPPVSGWPHQVALEAAARGYLREEPGVAFDDTPLLDLLTWMPPPLSGLFPGPDAVVDFLRHHGLPAEASAHELDERGRRTLASGLAIAHLAAKRRPADLARLFAPCHVAQRFDGTCTAHIAGWFEAAAHEGEAGLALGLALGDTTAKAELETVQTRHRATLRTLLRRVAPPTAVDAWTRMTIDDPALVARVARLVAERVEPTRPSAVDAPSVDGTLVAIHAAAAARAGFHAGQTLLGAAEAVGGVSYGGAKAAVARVPTGRAAEVFQRLDRTLLTERAA